MQAEELSALEEAEELPAPKEAEGLATTENAEGLSALEEVEALSVSEEAEELETSENVEEPMALAGAEESIPIDEAHFPDEYFRKYLLGELDDYQGADTDGDKSLSVEERESVRSIRIHEYPIKDLTGIFYFPNVSSIDMSKTLLTSIDLSGNSNIETLSLFNNTKLENINLSGCSQLSYLNVVSCAIAELNLNDCSQLQTLDCNNNQLTALDLSKVPQLRTLDCGDNQLKTLDLSKVSQLSSLNVSVNYLTELKIGNLKELTYLICSQNPLQVLDVGANTKLSTFRCNGNFLTALDVSQNIELTILECSSNELKQLDISKNSKLKYLNLNGNYITFIDTSGNPLLQMETYETNWYTNSIPAVVSQLEDGRWLLDLSEQEGFSPERYTIAEWYDDSNVPELTEQGVIWQQNPIQNGEISVALDFNLSESGYLENKKLRCNYSLRKFALDESYVELNEANFPDENFRNYLKQQYGDRKFQPGLITELNVSSLPELKDLTGISYFTSLSSLSLYDNPKLETVDLSKNKNLTALYLDRTAIRSLDLRENIKLQTLSLYGAPVTSLYLAKDCMMTQWLNTSNLTATAVEENGRYVLDLSQYGPVDQKRIVELSDGQLEGEKIYWDSEAEVPITFSYKFLLRGDYKEGMKYEESDVLNVLVSLTNHAPETPAGVTIDLTKENFPSESLLQYLKQNFDTDGDGKLKTEEVTYLSLGNGGEITSMEGIEHLNCLQSLSISGAPLRSLDLSSNKVLTNLDVTWSSLTDLTLTGCSYLEEANLNGNSLTQLDLSQNQMLRGLDLSGNSLTQLDLSANVNLKRIDVTQNAILELDLSNNRKLQSLCASFNPNMSELRWPSNKSALKELRICGNKITVWPVEEMIALEILDIDTNGGNLKKLNLTNHTKLKELYVDGILLNINWDKMPYLESVNIRNAGFTKIDLSKAANLTSCSIGQMSGLTELDVHGLEKLGSLSVYGTKLQKLDLTGCSVLSDVTCSYNELESLDLSSCSGLKTLYCDNNKLKTLDITKNGALQGLYCQYNQLTTIDTTKNPALKWFECSNNPIVSLDLSNNKAMLTDLNCMSTSLTSLDLGDNEVLENVQLDNQVLLAPASALQPETTQVRAAGTTGEAGSEFALGHNTEVSNAGAASGRYILRLDQYGSFDPNKVKNLSSGTATAKGILWESKSQIPDYVTYEYDISNRYKLSGRTMPVTISLNGSVPGITGPEIPQPGPETIQPQPGPGTIQPQPNPGTNTTKPQVTKKKKLSACKIALKSSSLTYTGKALKPAITIKDGKRVLKAGTDYVITYKNNKKPGKATIILNGKGNYTGKVTKYFTIKKAAQKFTYTKSYTKAYGSKAFSLKLKRKAGNGKLTYKSSNSKVAVVNKKGKVTIKGHGIATITVKAASTAYYNASSIKITIKVSPVKQKIKALKGKAGKKIVVSWNKDKNATGYQIQYCTSKNFKKGVKTVKISKRNTTSTTLKKLTAGKKYYVRVRSYQTVKFGGKKQTVYGAFSGVKKSGKVKK